MTIFTDWVTRELQKRASVAIDADGNIEPGKVLVSTGVGSRTTATEVPILGGWSIKEDTDFVMEPYNHYICNIVAANRTAVLPAFPTDKMTFMLKVTVASGKNLFITRPVGATYTMALDTDPLEIDYSADITLVYDQVTNNWVV